MNSNSSIPTENNGIREMPPTPARRRDNRVAIARDLQAYTTNPEGVIDRNAAPNSITQDTLVRPFQHLSTAALIQQLQAIHQDDMVSVSRDFSASRGFSASSSIHAQDGSEVLADRTSASEVPHDDNDRPDGSANLTTQGEARRGRLARLRNFGATVSSRVSQIHQAVTNDAPEAREPREGLTATADRANNNEEFATHRRVPVNVGIPVNGDGPSNSTGPSQGLRRHLDGMPAVNVHRVPHPAGGLGISGDFRTEVERVAVITVSNPENRSYTIRIDLTNAGPQDRYNFNINVHPF
ncbi:hypothetical protein diail_439 [Diaporthe ilicicola]|nr:hypothetical protein diail_439 [Diaporthe ilicicola]